MVKFDLLKSEKRSQRFDSVTYADSEVHLWSGESYSTPRKKRTRIIIIAVVLLVIVAIVVGLAIGLRKKESDDNEENNYDKQEQGTTIVPSTQTTPEAVTPSTVITSSTPHRSTTSTQPSPVNWLSEPCNHQEDPPRSCPWSENPVLLVSLDGFRAEYILRNITPVIEKLRQCGVHTPYMRAAYPTLTFPNHYTIITGLYPESHGIVGNSMYDAQINASFSLRSKEKSNPEWWGGEPLWTTARKQGKKTAAYFWVGSDVNISGSQPDFWKMYDGSVTYEERVDTVLEWLSKPEAERPDFITLYFDEPDHQGHGTGPESPEVDAMLGKVDTIIRRLMDGLLRKNIDHCVNTIILADHGMAKTSCERKVLLKDYRDLSDMLVFSGTTGHINPRYKKTSGTVYENAEVVPADEIISSLECKNSHLGVFTQDTIPVRHHYTNNDRIGDVVMDIEQSWLVFPDKGSSYCLKGNHGYDNIYKSMHALFLAHGPNFKHNLTVAPFENIELYNLMSELLKISPAPNNGTVGTLHHLLRDRPNLPEFVHTTTYPECSNKNTARTYHENCTCNTTTDYIPPTNPGDEFFPFGKPDVASDIDHCMISGNQYSSIFSHGYRMPVMSAFTLTPPQVKQSNATKRNCIVPDPRFSDKSDPMCQEFENIEEKIQYAHIFIPEFSSTDSDITEALLSSNKVPMYTGFKGGIWNYLWRVIKEYSTKYGSIHIVSGPVFDHNFDGKRDITNNDTVYVSSTSSVPLPTHFYVTLTKCSDQSTNISKCGADALDILSFVLPHQNHTHNCMPDKNFLKNNVARLRDIELLTGLRFFTSFERSVGARLRTFLPTELWASPLLTPWEELPCPLAENSTCPSGPLPLLLISLDGFRADYLDRHLTPTIRRLAKCGVHTPYMRSVYPTVTFPNHYSIVTGLYPESHGIIANSMYDEEIDTIFKLSKPTAKDPRWWKGEPLWITAKKQGLKTATYFWPGSDVNITGTYPDIWKPYDGSAGYTQRVYDVLGWITMPEDTRPEFITLYFDQPDHAGHEEGPESDEVNGQLETVDELLNILMTNLYERNLHSCVNMIVLADHGMSDQKCEKTVVMKDYYPNITNMLMFDRVFGQVFPQFRKDGSTSAQRLSPAYPISDIVDSAMCKDSAMKVFTKETLPSRHHYTNSARIGEVLLDMKDEWLVFSKRAYYCNGGNHGWDNTYKNMHALFLAHGPAFKENFTAQPFENIELYNLMSEILDITPANNNGTFGSLHYILRNPKSLSNDSSLPRNDTCSPVSEKPITSLCGCKNNITLNTLTVYGSDGGAALVFGLPHYAGNDSICVLYQNDSATGFSKSFRSPIWTSYIVTNHTFNVSMTASNDVCVVEDTRVSKWTSNTCQANTSSSGVEFISLHSVGSFGSTEEVVHLSSSLTPVYSGFKSGIWAFIQELIADYTTLYGKLSVTMGTIYDYNHDGLWEGLTNITRFSDTNNTVPIPSHVFVVIIKCKAKGKEFPCDGKVDILSFIIPNLETIPNCLKKHVYLKDNVARLRDIELLTNLKFMTTFDISTAARLRTYLPEDIWKTTLVKDWSEVPCPHQDQCQSEYKPLLLISLDGFRADYLLRNMTPTISRLSQCGVHAPYMRSVYPTKTFPNHYSIVTGLYPESHGIIDNNMYDQDIGEKFYMGSETSRDSRWWGGDPIWLTAKKQGLNTSAFFWPGSDVPIQGMHPDIWKAYDGSVSYSSRVDTVLSWMALPDGERPDFITLYFDEPDLAGHKHGPSDVEEIGAALDKVDETIAQLMNGLVEKNLHNCVNLVIIADHGMEDVSCKQLVKLKYDVDYDYLSKNTYVWEGAFGRIANTYIYNSTTEDILPAQEPASTADLFANLTCASPHMNVYRKSSLPVRHHYTNNDRIDDFLLDMESGWLVTRSYIKTCWGGNHGFDNIDKSMEALFLAYGPAFKWNVTVEPFENIELYNMFADVLNITASPNNGTAGSLNHILQNPRTQQQNHTDSYRNSSTAFADADDYVTYVRSSACFRHCTYVTTDMIHNVYNSLISTANSSVISEHAPLGIPMIDTNSDLSRNAFLLQQLGYIAGYNDDISSPMWISRTMSSTQSGTTATGCILPDPRVKPNIYDGTGYCGSNSSERWTALFRDDLLVGASPLLHYVSTNYMKMSESFINATWTPLQNHIRDRVNKHTEINVVVGPVFDHNHDSLPDSIQTIRNETLASHFYVILTSCQESGYSLNQCQALTTNAYILPNSAVVTICKTFEEYLLQNEARVRDVELITGLNFFTALQYDDGVRLRTLLPQRP